MNNLILIIKGSLICLTLLMVLSLGSQSTLASDMPMAPGSPIAGIAFDDQPLILPVQRNFQMAMLTAGSELGRSCGRIESYGWRLGKQEQVRVNQIFNNTVDRIRAQGFSVKVQQTNAVSSDVTLFTADNRDKHLLLLWSAGDIGLVLVLCETSPPISATPLQHSAKTTQPSSYPMPQTIAPDASLSSRIAAGSNRQPRQLTRTGKIRYEDFTPKGRWVGSYTCAQGTTGASFEINDLKGEHFEGTFRFYPTDKNPYVPKGKYEVFGEYDAESQRLLINPGKWIDRPKNFFSTIMIGSFNPTSHTLSAYFQGVAGCTSFEARYEAVPEPVKDVAAKKVKKTKKKIKKKKRWKKKVSKKKTKKSVKKKVKKTEPAIKQAVVPLPQLGPIKPVSTKPLVPSAGIQLK